MEDTFLPAGLQTRLCSLPFREESIGQSGSRVFIYEDCVLKTGPATPEAAKEAELLSWLAGRLPAPECLYFDCDEKSYWLLMSRIRGDMACEDRYMADPAGLMSTLAEAIELLWATDTRGCPVSDGLDEKLARAEIAVEKGAVDVENAEEGTFGPGGFASPEALLSWLKNNRPGDDPVFSHGDLCLPNVLLTSRGLSGFIDLGRSGVCHRWNDIAILRRSLIHNYRGRYARKIYAGFDEDMLISALGLKKDPELLRYFVLLDELG